MSTARPTVDPAFLRAMLLSIAALLALTVALGVHAEQRSAPPAARPSATAAVLAQLSSPERRELALAQASWRSVGSPDATLIGRSHRLPGMSAFYPDAQTVQLSFPSGCRVQLQRGRLTLLVACR